MFRLAALLGLLGLAVATGLIVWSGWAQVLQALAQAGIGILIVTLFHGISLIISSASWQVLVPGKNRPKLVMFIYFMWIRAAVNNLMPVARIGGEIAAVRMMTFYGMRKSVAIGSTVVELTISIAAIFLFVLTGVILFTMRVNDQHTVRQMLWGVLLSLPMIVLLIAVQRIGFFVLLSRLFRVAFRDKWIAMVSNAALLDRAVTTIYRRHNRVVACGIMQLIAWSLGSVEIWLALYFLGHSLPFIECVMLEALIQGSASAAFAVPGALGVQEAGFLVFGGMLGLSHETAAALAVIRRCRDLLFYAPGLVAWQMHEGKKLLRTI
jgi:putative membrane protein